MERKFTLRLATVEDAPQILEIYTPYVRDTEISFEEEVPSREEFQARIGAVTAVYPYVVCENRGKICGFAYATRHRERVAYRFNVETSIYIAPECHGLHMGKALYLALFQLLRELGYYNAYAGIALHNPKSEGLHKSVGFSSMGIAHATGYKHGRWLDVVWLEKELQPHAAPPEEPRRISALDKEALNRVLQKYEMLISAGASSDNKG